MRTKPEPKGAFKKEARTVVDAQRSIRDDSEIDESTKEQIVRFMSYLAVDNLKLKTIASYAVSLRKLAKLCPGKGFLRLQRGDVQQMILALQEEGYQTSTMNLFKARLLRFLRWLREEFVLSRPDEFLDRLQLLVDVSSFEIAYLRRLLGDAIYGRHRVGETLFGGDEAAALDRVCKHRVESRAVVVDRPWPSSVALLFGEELRDNGGGDGFERSDYYRYLPIYKEGAGAGGPAAPDPSESEEPDRERVIVAAVSEKGVPIQARDVEPIPEEVKPPARTDTTPENLEAMAAQREEDRNTARGQEDFLSDIPLSGTGVVGSIGGGGAGSFGFRTGGGRPCRRGRACLRSPSSCAGSGIPRRPVRSRAGRCP